MGYACHALLISPEKQQTKLFSLITNGICMAKTGATGFTRLINAAGYSWLGFKAAYRNEAAFRQELWLAIALAPAALYYAPSYSDKAVLIASLVLILLVEMLNSAIESVVDRHGDELHPLSGRAKDMGSAAVFLAFVITGLIWFSVLVK